MQTHIHALALSCLISLAPLFHGCALFKPQDETANMNAKQIYDLAKENLEANEFEAAIGYFETLESRYPFDRYALQAQLDIAYAYYQDDEYDAALSAADRFIKLHPRHTHVAYAYYLKGLTNYNRGQGLFEKLMPRNFSKIGQGALKDAYHDFALLVQKYPNSRYTHDARLRMAYLNDKMAEYELAIAHYYYQHGAWIATINRIKYLLENHATTPSTPGALNLMVRAYEKMGLETLAADTQRILKLNYPDHKLAP